MSRTVNIYLVVGCSALTLKLVAPPPHTHICCGEVLSARSSLVNGSHCSNWEEWTVRSRRRPAPGVEVNWDCFHSAAVVAVTCSSQ